MVRPVTHYMNTLKDLFPDKDKKTKNQMVEKGITKVRRHVDSARNRDSESETCYGHRLLREAIPLIVIGINDWNKQQRKAPVPSNAYVELQKLNPKVVAYIALKSVIDSLSQRRALSSAAIRVGALIEDEMRFQSFSTHPKWEGMVRGAGKRPNYQKKRYYLIHSQNEEAKKGEGEYWEKWGTRIKLHIGTVLIGLIRSYTGLIDFVMVSTQTTKGSTRFITPTKLTTEWIEGMIQHNELLTPFWMPLLEFPKPWTDKWAGGYDESYGLPPLPMIKLRNKSFLRLNDEPMTEVMSCLNALQDTPWQVNDHTLMALTHIWENDTQLGDLPAQKDVELPPFPEDDPDENVKRNWKRKAASIYEFNTSTRSRRILVLNTIGLAQKFKGERFFLPHQCDFRGRAYAVPAYLTHMGADFAKGLLRFHKGVECKNDEELKWLFIQGANTYGVKGTFDERITWVWKNKDMILEVAKHPESCVSLLSDASEPFQFISFADEFARLIKKGAKGFITHLPCQMDASNNGLQILGMLTRDEKACIATNVANNKTPHDIYGIVAQSAVKALRAEIDTNPYAKEWLAFGVDRGCAKRPTMTQPYGSTTHSCRNYVHAWYLERVRNGQRDPFDDNNRFKATAYLSSKIWEAINVVVGKPREAMAWLQGVARTLCDENIPMDWVSPSGFPVHQAYEQFGVKSIRTKIGEKILRVKFREDIGKLSRKRQAQGSSPNFVHSLDAACLHLTVNKCRERGIESFAMVHDSYGTHAPHCDLMAEVIRETLHEIFQLDLLGNLKETIETVSGVSLDPLPEYGGFDINEVLKSKYIFS